MSRGSWSAIPSSSSSESHSRSGDGGGCRDQQMIIDNFMLQKDYLKLWSIAYKIDHDDRRGWFRVCRTETDHRWLGPRFMQLPHTIARAEKNMNLVRVENGALKPITWLVSWIVGGVWVWPGDDGGLYLELPPTWQQTHSAPLCLLLVAKLPPF